MSVPLIWIGFVVIVDMFTIFSFTSITPCDQVWHLAHNKCQQRAKIHGRMTIQLGIIACSYCDLLSSEVPSNKKVRILMFDFSTFLRQGCFLNHSTWLFGLWLCFPSIESIMVVHLIIVHSHNTINRISLGTSSHNISNRCDLLFPFWNSIKFSKIFQGMSLQKHLQKTPQPLAWWPCLVVPIFRRSPGLRRKELQRTTRLAHVAITAPIEHSTDGLYEYILEEVIMCMNDHAKT